ncbi:MAG: ferrochelatase [Alphaproteobacteria bacterium]|nr:ferrochelatase [Alphaproteobacteria bacterium]
MLKKTADPTEHFPTGHPNVAYGKIGVLLVNLGTPEGTSYWPMRRYLKEFLSDERVIDVSRPIWWFILNCIILTTRPTKSGEAYKQIWNHELNESPLKTITRSQAEKVADALADHPRIMVDWAMRYGLPPIKEKIERLRDAGCDRVLLFPLYPQYAAATTASVQDKAFDALKLQRWQPAIRTVPAFHDYPVYIDAVVSSMNAHLGTLDWTPDLVLASFHGLPQRYLDLGDPYHCHWMKTARLMREKLGWGKDKLQVVFQSRFGKEEWLKPYAEDTVRDLAKNGTKNLAMIMPAFIADCVETLEEIAIGLKEVFEENGGDNFTAVPCLNDSDDGIKMLAALVENELAGWL